MTVTERSSAAVKASADLQHDSGGDLPEEEVLPPSSTRPATASGSQSTGTKTAASTGQPAVATAGKRRELTPPSAVEVVGALVNWGTCIFIIFLVVAQFCGVFWDSVDTRANYSYGRSPALGPFQITGLNDAAFTDRALACVLEGRFYKPMTIAAALDTSSTAVTTVVDTTGATVNGYRVTSRTGLELNAAADTIYSDVCSLLATTKDAVFDTCTALGYSLANDALRVVASDEPDKTVRIDDALPVLILPYWDNAPTARFAIPGTDGSACVFRLAGKYFDSGASRALMEIVDRDTRESKTLEWLVGDSTSALAAQATWKNGWVHVPGVGDGDFFADVISSDEDSTLGIPRRVFNPESKQELSCATSADCAEDPIASTWGDDFSMKTYILKYTSVAAATDTQFGLFQYTSTHRTVVSTTYGWETLISNVCLSFVLGRWLVAMTALLAGYGLGKSEWFNGGIGCVSSSRAFNVLPIALLPRLPVTLSAFWTVGCMFEGDQSALSECWFAVYPAVVEVLFIYYSLLNIVAKLARRRMPDVLFAPTVIALCAIHRARQEIAQSGIIGVDGRVSTLVTSAEAADLSLLDFFTTDVSWRLNGAITSLFAVKIVMLAVNLLPLLVAEYIPPAKQPDTGLRGVEKALAIRASNVGGLGRSPIYIYEAGAAPPPKPWLHQIVPCLGVWLAKKSKKRELSDTSAEKKKAVADGKLALNSYELVRLGYVVLGGRYLITLDAWDTMWTTVVLKRIYYLYNHRVVLFPLQEQQNLAVVNGKPQMCRLDDERLEDVPFWKIAAQPVKC